MAGITEFGPMLTCLASAAVIEGVAALMRRERAYAYREKPDLRAFAARVAGRLHAYGYEPRATPATDRNHLSGSTTSRGSVFRVLELRGSFFPPSLRPSGIRLRTTQVTEQVKTGNQAVLNSGAGAAGMAAAAKKLPQSSTMEHAAANTYEIHPLRDPRWTSLVESHPGASVFHSTNWLSALRTAHGYDPVVVTTCPQTPL
jgi:hypothetical protein